jgi:hypothetical protein
VFGRGGFGIEGDAVAVRGGGGGGGMLVGREG